MGIHVTEYRRIFEERNLLVNDLQQGIMNAGGVCCRERSRLSADGDRTRPDLQLIINGRCYLVHRVNIN